MHFYHNWFYEYILNTKWFLWTIVWIVIAINVLGPAMIWIIMSGKKDTNKQKDRAGTKNESGEGPNEVRPDK